MSWGRHPEKWGKQVAVRFMPFDLQQLDELVAQHATSYGYNAETRSSVIVKLVREEYQRTFVRPRGASDASSSVAPVITEPAVDRASDKAARPHKKLPRQTQRPPRQTARSRRQTTRGGRS